MLTVEEKQNSLKHSIELDHCYTSRLSPSEPKTVDPLPITTSPEAIQKQHSVQTTPTAPSSTVSPASANAAGNLRNVSVFLSLKRLKFCNRIFVNNSNFFLKRKLLRDGLEEVLLHLS